jgi:hypothetical protein
VAVVPTGPKEPKSTSLSLEDEAIIVAFRKHTLLPLDDCLYALQATIPHLTRSSLHRCLQRHGISRLPDVEDGKGVKRKFKTYPIGYFYDGTNLLAHNFGSWLAARKDDLNVIRDSQHVAGGLQ